MNKFIFLSQYSCWSRTGIDGRLMSCRPLPGIRSQDTKKYYWEQVIQMKEIECIIGFICVWIACFLLFEY